MNFNKSVFFLLVVLFCVPQEVISSSGITYSFSGGRFGDNLLSYCRVCWLSYVHGLDFYYKPFRYSDELAMHKIHQHHFDGHNKAKEVEIDDGLIFSELLKNEDSDTMYIGKPFVKKNPINWDDKAFVYLLRKEIKPINSLEMVNIPKNHKSVALHIRRGGGWDRPLCQADTICTTKGKKLGRYSEPCVDRAYPRRFAPDTYYIESLQYLLEVFSDQHIYVYIFTDDPQPELIAQKYKEAVNSSRLTFGYREEKNSHDANVLEDFFSMQKFDCLIRPASGFSRLAGLLGRVKFEMTPTKYRWDENVLTITRVAVIERENGNVWKSSKRYMNLN